MVFSEMANEADPEYSHAELTIDVPNDVRRKKYLE
jgi:hypothetical protein